MNNKEHKYHFPKLLAWIGIAELVFWVLFVFFNALIALLKSERIISSFLVYQQPAMLWFLLLLPLIYLIYLSNLSWKNRVLNQTFAMRLQQLLMHIPNLRVSFWRFFVLRTAFVFVVLALANPQGGTRAVNIEGMGGEFVVAVDVSRSMLVRDMDNGRSRLDAVKNGLSNLTRNMPQSSMSIVVFAGSAFPHLPMTRDLQSVSSYVDALSTDMIGEQGTHIAEAIRVSLRSFSAGAKNKVIYLISDGEDHEGGLDAALAEAQQESAIIHVIAVGSQIGGPIPEKQGGVKRNSAGEIISSVPDFELLKEIAQKTQGRFWKETSAFPNFAGLVKQSFQSHPHTQEMESKMRKSYGSIFALQAFLLLLAYLVMIHLNPKTNEHE
jgi:Ca-activated chloride channel family protein